LGNFELVVSENPVLREHPIGCRIAALKVIAACSPKFPPVFSAISIRVV